MLSIKEQTLPDDAALLGVIARDLIGRVRFGKVVIVAAQPDRLLPMLRKQWLKELQREQHKLPSILGAGSATRYVDLATLSKHTRFTAKSPYAELFADVYLITPDQLAEFGPYGRTLYVTCSANMTVLEQIASFMPDDGSVVIYKAKRT